MSRLAGLAERRRPEALLLLLGRVVELLLHLLLARRGLGVLLELQLLPIRTLHRLAGPLRCLCGLHGRLLVLRAGRRCSRAHRHGLLWTRRSTALRVDRVIGRRRRGSGHPLRLLLSGLRKVRRGRAGGCGRLTHRRTGTLRRGRAWTGRDHMWRKSRERLSLRLARHDLG